MHVNQNPRSQVQMYQSQTNHSSQKAEVQLVYLHLLTPMKRFLHTKIDTCSRQRDDNVHSKYDQEILEYNPRERPLFAEGVHHVEASFFPFGCKSHHLLTG